MKRSEFERLLKAVGTATDALYAARRRVFKLSEGAEAVVKVRLDGSDQHWKNTVVGDAVLEVHADFGALLAEDFERLAKLRRAVDAWNAGTLDELPTPEMFA